MSNTKLDKYRKRLLTIGNTEEMIDIINEIMAKEEFSASVSNDGRSNIIEIRWKTNEQY